MVFNRSIDGSGNPSAWYLVTGCPPKPLGGSTIIREAEGASFETIIRESDTDRLNPAPVTGQESNIIAVRRTPEHQRPAFLQGFCERGINSDRRKRDRLHFR